MNKKVVRIILFSWVGATSLLDLSIGVFSFFTIAYMNPTDYEYVADTFPIHIIVVQIIGSLLVFLFGIIWSSIILLATERLLVFLKFPTAGNNKFSKFSLGLFKIALLSIAIALLMGNISLIYHQMQGK